MKIEDTAICVEAMDFAYEPDQPVLRQLHLSVPRGAIYGFLGANGAGKSTTIRAILGLLRPRSGRIRLCGEAMPSGRRKALPQTGALIESPSLYPHLSGYDNLKIACAYLDLPRIRIEEVLEWVNLRSHARKLAGRYSTGMKQRLGLAMALLNDPELLILDEPTNGLDPHGIIEIRNVLRELNERGKTIFLSSHLLPEVERIATQVGILRNGALAFQGPIEELEALRQSHLQVRVVTTDASRAARLIGESYASEVCNPTTLRATISGRDDLPALVERLTAGGLSLYELTPEKNDLEDLFIHLTQN